MEITVSQIQGWAGLIDAASRAVAGDMIRIGAGSFEGRASIALQSNVTLTCEDGCELIYSGAGSAIVAAAAPGIVIDGLVLRCGEVVPSERDESPSIFDPLVRIDSSDEVTVRNCKLQGSRRRQGLGATDSKRVLVQGNTVGGFDVGVWITRSDGQLSNNRCHDNTQGGIAVFSSRALLLANECWANCVGISIQRDSKSLTAPSDAELSDNRCHDNTEAGIAVFSSKASVRANECWANRSGISIERDPRSPTDPSNAELSDNRCHDNTQAGIAVFSSKASVRANECWANRSGISIQRQLRSLTDPSDAELSDNRCHDNTESGIIVFSSKASVRANECWANRHSGIAIEWDPRYPTDPSDAELSDNRCHDNTESGIVVFSSKASVRANECWANGYGIIIARQTGLPVGIDLEPKADLTANFCRDNHLGASNAAARLDGCAATTTASLFQESIVAKLVSENVSDPWALAGFLSSGCRGCFERFWAATAMRNPRLLSRAAERELAHDAQTVTPHAKIYSVSIGQKDSSGSSRSAVHIVAQPLGGPNLTPEGIVTEQFVELFKGLYVGQKSPVRWLGLVTARESAADELIDGASAKAMARLKRARANRILRKHHIRRQVVDYTARNDYGVGKELLAPLFTSERLALAPRWRQRLQYLATLPWMWRVMACVGTAVFCAWLPPLAPFSALILSSVISMAAHLSLMAIAGLSVWVLFIMLLLDWFVLPRPLNFIAPQSAEDKADVFYTLLPLEPLKPVLRLIPIPKQLAAVAAAARAWSTRRWLRQGLFGPPWSMTCFVLRNVESWRPEDIEAFSDLLSSVPAQRVAYIILQMDDRSFVQPGLFHFMHSLERVSPDGVRLIFDDEVGTNQSSVDAKDITLANLDKILGWADEDSNRCEELRNTLLDDNWSIFDMLPTLAIAAAPTARFWLHLPSTVHGHAELEQEMRPYMDIFTEARRAPSTTPTISPHLLGDQALQSFKRYAKFAKGIQYNEVRSGGKPLVRLEGRIGSRALVIKQLEPLWAEEVGDGPPHEAWGFDNFLSAAMACGEWRLLQDLRELFRLGVDDSRRARKALNGFKALRTLALERMVLGAARPLQAMLAEPWLEVAAAMDTALPPEIPKEMPRDLRSILLEIYSEFLAACEIYVPSAETWPSLALEVERRIGANPDSLGSAALSLRDLFVLDLARTISTSGLMERRSVSAMIDRRKDREWRALPEALIGFLTRSMLSSAPESLADALMEARDAAEIEAVVTLHQGQGRRLVFLLSAAAAAHIRRDLNLTPETKQATLAQIGLNLSRICTNLGLSHDSNYFGSPTFKSDLGALARQGTRAEALASYMSDASFEPTIPNLLEEHRDPSVIPGVLDNELDRVLLVSERVLRMRYGERRYDVIEPENRSPSSLQNALSG